MSSISVVIPSKIVSNLVPCVAALAANEPHAKIIVVDDGLDLSDGEQRTFIESHCTIIAGEKPFVFARNVNLGIQAAGADDVVVMNDDALLDTPGGLSMMGTFAENIPELGIISAACNNVGNVNQHARRQDRLVLRMEPRMVCFVCVFIPRRTIEAVGLLDQRFIFYGMDDDDYCLRIRKQGLIIGICDGCVVDHSKLNSTFRGADNGGGRGGDYRPNLKLFIEKWGVDNWGQQKDTSRFPELFPGVLA